MPAPTTPTRQGVPLVLLAAAACLSALAALHITLWTRAARRLGFR
jgi:hypothetical protein